MTRTPSSLPLALRCELGEGPVWDAAREVVLVVDIGGGALWEIALGGEPTATEVLRCGTTLGAAAPADDGGYLLAAGKALRHVDAAGTTIREIALLPPSVDSRLNDGAVDPAGRYLVGSLANDGRRGQERLWRLEHDGGLTVVDDDLTLSNGLGWSPDGGTFYSIDSIPGTIWARDYDPATGRTGTRHRLLDIVDGTPDGLAIDADGNLWVAMWGRGEVRGLTPAGEVLEVIKVAAPLSTSCAFVGPDLSTLLVTSACMAVEGIAQPPTAGSLFTVEMSVRGQCSPAWRPVPVEA